MYNVVVLIYFRNITVLNLFDSNSSGLPIVLMELKNFLLIF